MNSLPREVQLRWVEAAGRAPSGFNRQPWLCRFRRGEVEVFERPGTEVYFEVDGRYSAIDLAGFAHYLAEEALSAGWGAELESVASARPVRLTLHLARSVRAQSPHGLPPRSTYRGRYQRTNLPLTLDRQLRQTADRYGVEANLVDRPEDIALLAAHLARFEHLSLRCPRIRAEVLRGLSLRAGSPTGIPLTALELSPLLRMGLRLAASRPGDEILWRVVAAAYGKIASARIASSSVLIGFSVRGTATQDFVSLGHAFNAAWLAAAAGGLAGCPISSFAYPRLCPKGCRRLCRRLISDGGWPPALGWETSIVLRVGSPLGEGHRAPRLAATEVLVRS